jgi:transposase
MSGLETRVSVRKEFGMIIIGCDFHPSFQQIAMLDTETGVPEEHKLMHTSGEAESFYRKLASPAIVGIEPVRK